MSMGREQAGFDEFVGSDEVDEIEVEEPEVEITEEELTRERREINRLVIRNHRGNLQMHLRVHDYEWDGSDVEVIYPTPGVPKTTLQNVQEVVHFGE